MYITEKFKHISVLIKHTITDGRSMRGCLMCCVVIPVSITCNDIMEYQILREYPQF